MDKHALWKWLFFIFLVTTSLALVWPPSEKVPLGIDLKGGMSFVIEVKMDDLSEDAKKDAPQRALEVIRQRVDAVGTREPIIYLESQRNRIVVQLPGVKAEQREEMVSLLQSAAFLEFRMIHEDNDQLVAELYDKGVAPKGHRMVSLDESTGDGRTQRNYYYRRVKAEEEGYASDEEIRADLNRLSKAGHELMLMRVDRQGTTLYEPYFVNRRAQLTGESLENAGVDYQQFGQPIVTLKFDAQGGKRFARLTADHAPGGARNPNPDGRRYLGIVLDGTLHSAPFIRTAIYGGEAIIEGNFTVPEAQHLSIILRAGSLPAPVEVVEERGVDPTLGRDSIVSGVRAAVYGAIAVSLFMLLYYRVPGMVANAALILDMLLLPLGMLIVSGFMGLFTDTGMQGGALSLPTLTLPGIAGIVLTIGMAVDANVLIYERMREEQKAGKRLKGVVAAGFEKAFSAIFDSNITTLLSAVILFLLGSGPIRGYAVTLSAGIIVSMYTVLVVGRLIFEFIANHSKSNSFRMLTFVGETRIDWLGKRFLAGGLSVVLIVATMTLFFMRGTENLGVDFTGGRSISMTFSQKVAEGDIRQALSQAGIKESFIQYQESLASGDTAAHVSVLEVKVAVDEGDTAKAAILGAFPDAGLSVVQEDVVGPQVGHELRRKGILAIVWSLIGMIIYISWRFEFAFAMGAIVAILHDVLVTVGIFCLLGRQLSLTVVAALLTIVGYSVNDTIVIFDRIREDLKLNRDRSYKDVCNLSINQTLSRTILTSFTVFLTVLILLVFGGGAINDFALAMLIGTIAGTYSTVFIATPIMLLWHREKKPEVAPAKS